MRIVLAALIATAVAVTTPAVAGPPRCDRMCVIEIADTYLAALVSHDGSKVPLAKDVVRVENGAESGNGEEELRSSLSSPIMFVITGIRELEWDVDGNVAVATYLMDTVTSPTYIVERFELAGRLIKRIDANFYIDASGYAAGPESIATRPQGQSDRFTAYNHGPAGPVPMPGNPGDTASHPRAAGCNDTCVARSVRGVVSVLSTHRAGSLNLAPDAELLVNRRSVATGAGPVRAALQAATITSTKGLMVTADGTTGAALYNAFFGSDVSHAALNVTMRGRSIARISVVCDHAVNCLA